ncbi:hypothetical protein T05_9891 [Trichinella murrelli]|uniref:Uncharacterized protein n=1 Tax=Trichinella murrelli TaxID=144512 RepID=A0A0V0T3G6_9BILA|nr:hypothetical protein T05_9549 [Trichinella murrelli]KRX33800.1 hypothetical protein T05_9891 [Trichinella murrelli]
MSSFVMLVQNTRLACDPFFKLLSTSSYFASIALPRKCSFLAFASSIMMDSMQSTETPALSTKCWRQNLIRFLGVSQTLSNNRSVLSMPDTGKTRDWHTQIHIAN